MCGVSLLLCLAITVPSATAEVRRDEAAQRLDVLVDGRQVFAYQYGQEFAIPHYWPVRSPSGKLLTQQVPDPFPHHRSLWIADKIKMPGESAVDFYHCWNNYRETDRPQSGYRHFIQHQRFKHLEASHDTVRVETILKWIVDERRSVLDDRRAFRVRALGRGEYFIDLQWKLTASYGEVKVVSDNVHYAWPYVRIHPQFSGEQGGTITNDRGQRGQTQTHGQAAHWMDYSNTVNGTTEGLAIFVYSEGKPPGWLTREYGTFGPRRAEQWSGTGFTLEKNESIRGRVGILIHRGDARAGRVAERFEHYIEGKL